MSRVRTIPAVLLALAAPVSAAGAQSAGEVGAQAVRPPSQVPAQATTLRLASPDGRNVVTVELRADTLRWAVARGGQQIFLPSKLGFAFRNAPKLQGGLRIVEVRGGAIDETLEPNTAIAIHSASRLQPAPNLQPGTQ